jgi:predicted secreted protein
LCFKIKQLFCWQQLSLMSRREHGDFVIADYLRRLGVRKNRKHLTPGDTRSGRLVFLIECILNQNARDTGAATCPAVDREVLDILLQNDVGMAQIPCPEMACLGFARTRPAGTSIRSALDQPDALYRCRLLAQQTAERIEDYRAHGVEVLAILGGNEASPGCAVHSNGVSGALRPESGVFMQALSTELAKRDIVVPFRGIRDADVGSLVQDIAWLRAQLSTPT